MNREAAAHTHLDNVSSIGIENFGRQTSLFLEFLNNSSAIADRLWPNRTASLEDFSKRVLNEYKTDRNVLCNALTAENEDYGCSAKTLANIELLRQKDSVAIITGQQAGFLTGPAYSIYKALSVVKLTAELRDKGINAVPLFWIASEDHDFTEIRTASFVSKSGDLITAALPDTPLGDNAHSIGQIVLDEGVDAVLEELFIGLGDKVSGDDLKEAATAAYSCGNSLTKAFAILLNAVLGDYGIVITNPMNPAIRGLSVPALTNAVLNAEDIQQSVHTRNQLLEQKGFHTQVHTDQDFFPLFYIADDGRRLALKYDSGLFRSKSADFSFDKSSLLEKIETEPSSFSPSALFRPLVQDYVFPTVCYIGGAAEVSYFAQNSAIYESLGMTQPQVRHRAGVTFLEARHTRTMKRYEIGFEDLLEEYEAVLRRLVEESSDENALAAFDIASDSLRNHFETLKSVVEEADSTLADNAERRKQKVAWHIDALKKKYLIALRRNNVDLTRRIGDLFAYAVPNDAPQERTICYLSFLSSHGSALTDLILEHIETSGRKHLIVRL